MRATHLLLLVACAGCSTQIPNGDGTITRVRTPCDGQMWAVRKKYGEPTQTLLRDHDYTRIRYYFSKTRTEYGFGWDNYGCHVSKQLHLTDDEIH